MQKKSSVKTLYFLMFTALTLLASNAQEPHTFDQLPLNRSQKAALEGGQFIVHSKIKTFQKGTEKNQSLDYFIIGLHPKSCDTALRRLSYYENYHQYLNFIEASHYHPQTKLISLTLGHTLLPFRMTMELNLPRLERPGIYQFSFDRGFLKDLQGVIEVSEYKNRCLFYSKAKWSGPHTTINDKVFAFFSTTLSRMAMEGLFRASLFP